MDEDIQYPLNLNSFADNVIHLSSNKPRHFLVCFSTKIPSFETPKVRMEINPTNNWQTCQIFILPRSSNNIKRFRWDRQGKICPWRPHISMIGLGELSLPVWLVRRASNLNLKSKDGGGRGSSRIGEGESDLKKEVLPGEGRLSKFIFLKLVGLGYSFYCQW